MTCWSEGVLLIVRAPSASHNRNFAACCGAEALTSAAIFKM